jgi:hypothetical protein
MSDATKNLENLIKEIKRAMVPKNTPMYNKFLKDKSFTIAGQHDVGIKFVSPAGVELEIIGFRPRATKYPYIFKDKAGNKSTGECSDYVIWQIRKGKITELR